MNNILSLNLREKINKFWNSTKIINLSMRQARRTEKKSPQYLKGYPDVAFNVTDNYNEKENRRNEWFPRDKVFYPFPFF